MENDFSPDDLTPIQKRGRSFEIDDPDLEEQRNTIVWVLEQNWGRVGYELTQLRKFFHIRNALAPLKTEIYADKFKDFLRSSTTYATPEEMRKTRHQQGEVIKQRQAAFHSEQEAHHSIDKIAQAVQQAWGTSDQQAMEQEYARRQAMLLGVQKQRADLDAKYQQMDDRLANDEAGFAQTELLDFILEHRYSFTPLNFSNAMAGLPYICWRQSSKRCVQLPCTIANSPPYRQFKVIAASLRSEVTSGSLVERMRLFLLRKTKASDDAAMELKRKFFYLSRAIEEIGRQEHPSEALPFRIMAEFQRRQTNANAVDRIREEEEQLWG